MDCVCLQGPQLVARSVQLAQQQQLMQQQLQLAHRQYLLQYGAAALAPDLSPHPGSSANERGRPLDGWPAYLLFQISSMTAVKLYSSTKGHVKIHRKDNFRKVILLFSLCQDASETRLKTRSHRSNLKKMVGKSLKNTHALMADRNYGSNYKGFFSEEGRVNSPSSQPIFRYIFL